MAEKKIAKKEKKDNPVVKESVFTRIKKVAQKDVKEAKPMVTEKAISDKDPMDVLKLVLMTEKSVRTVELQNKLVFIVDRKANKKDVKNAVQSVFQADVSDVNIMIDQKGRKKAFVKFTKPGIAGEVAIKLGII